MNEGSGSSGASNGASDDADWLRGGGLAGLAGVLTLLASLPLAPPWPPASAPIETVIAYFRDHRSGFLAQAWLAGAGVMLLVLYAAAWRLLMGRRGRELAGHGVLGATLLFVGAFGMFWMPWILIAFRPGLPADSVRLLYDLGLLGQFLGVGFPLALLFGSFTAGLRDSDLVPRWLVGLSALAVPLNLVLAGCTALRGPLSPSGPVGFASIGLFTVWMLATSIVMLRRARRLRAAEEIEWGRHDRCRGAPDAPR